MKSLPCKNFLSSESDSEDESSTSKKAKTVVTPPAPTAPKNNKPCFKCNQPGHFAKDCANEATCYKCKKVREAIIATNSIIIVVPGKNRSV